MKEVYISDIQDFKNKQEVFQLSCFIKGIRKHKRVVFLDLIDSTGEIQAVVNKTELLSMTKNLTKESCIEINGTKKDAEIILSKINIINLCTEHFSPSPREDFDVFNEKYADLVLSKKHVYLRNPKLIAIQNFRNLILYFIRDWFFQNKFIEITAPIITPIPLYEDKSAIPVVLHGQNLFLTQCAGYYLEASCVAHEKVYNIGPSFRGEEGRSKRHLLEYWHIKAELAFGDIEDIIFVVENLLKYLTERIIEHPYTKKIIEILETKLCVEALQIPFKRFSYRKAIEMLNEMGHNIEFGKSVSMKEEDILSKHLGSTFWLTGIPRSVEPFPYRIDLNDNEVTVVADLIASNGCGELLGVAEKIFCSKELEIRMKEKNKFTDTRYDWIREVHNSGCPPHIAFGMGVERLIRWLLNIEHVRDVHPFPRVFGRTISV